MDAKSLACLVVSSAVTSWLTRKPRKYITVETMPAYFEPENRDWRKMI